MTGVGAVTPYGLGVPVLRAGLLAGRPTAGPIRGFDASDLPVRFACEVPGFDAAAHLPAKLARRTDRFSHFALVAATEALAGAGLLTGADGPGLVAGVDRERVAVIVASGNGGGHGTGAAHEALRAGGPARVSAYLTVTRPVDAAAAAVSHRFGLGGPAVGIATACASGTDALGLALDRLRAGRADVVIARGAEAAVDRLTLAAFDVDRDGFVCGEGAAARARAARARRGPPRPAAPRRWPAWPATARPPTRTTPSSRRPTGPPPPGPCVSPCAVGTITDGLVPPTQNHDRTDPTCYLDVVNGCPRRVAPRVVVSEAFGFGGHDSAIVLVAP